MDSLDLACINELAAMAGKKLSYILNNSIPLEYTCLILSNTKQYASFKQGAND